MRRADHLNMGVLWMSVCFECCVLSCLGLFVGLITCKEESYICLSVLSAVFCQVEVGVTGRLLVQRRRMDVCLL